MATADRLTLLSRILAYLMVSSVFLYLINNYLVFWRELPGPYQLFSHLGWIGQDQAGSLSGDQVYQGWMQLLVYLVVLALGGIAHRAIIKALSLRQADYKFGHAAVHDLGPFRLLDSYHCSRYNTNTGRLTSEMFEGVFATAREMLQN